MQHRIDRKNEFSANVSGFSTTKNTHKLTHSSLSYQIENFVIKSQ